MKKLATLMALVAVAGLLIVAAPQDAQARPQYPKAAAKKYTKVADALGEKKCGACHGGDPLGKNKKLLSDYGKALKEALGAKNVKEEDKINAALDKAAEKPVKKGEDATFGSLLKDGKLPPPGPKE